MTVILQVLYPFQEAADVARDQEELPPVSRGRVFGACFQTSAVLVAFAFLLRTRAGALSAAVLHTDPAEVNRLLACELARTGIWAHNVLIAVSLVFI